MRLRRVLHVLPLLVLVAACGRPGGNAEGDGRAAGLPVEVVTLRGQEATLLIERVGVLRGSAEVEVVPKVAGRIREIRAVRGQKVSEGEVLAVIEQADYLDGLDQARAGLAVAEANRAQAELNVKRQRALFEEGIASDAALEAAESAYLVASAGVQQARAVLEMAGRSVEDTRIASPLDGYVSQRMVEVGSFVSPPGAAYTLVALDPLEIQVMVTGDKISRVHAGATVDVTVGALPGRRFHGKVTEVSVAADRMTGSFPVTVSLPNPVGELKDGMTASAALQVGKRSDAIVVSPDVLIERRGQWYAYVIRDSVAETRQVTPGEWVTGGVIVEEGLEPGETLVVKGQAYLNTGTRVRIEEVES